MNCATSVAVAQSRGVESAVTAPLLANTDTSAALCPCAYGENGIEGAFNSGTYPAPLRVGATRYHPREIPGTVRFRGCAGDAVFVKLKILCYNL